VSAPAITLLDASSTGTRLLQQAMLWTGILILAGSGIVIRKSPGIPPAGAIGALIGLGLMALTFWVRIRWSVEHRGHRIVVENELLRGSRLIVDGSVTTSRGRGDRSVLEARIGGSEPAGERIAAVTDAGFMRVRCQITVEPPAA